MNRKERLKKLKAIDIYPVTCQELSEGRTNLEVLAAVLAGGAKIIQLREKHWDKKDLYELAVEFRKRTRTHDALLIINDHLDVALAAGADGVHLGQEDLRPDFLLQWAGRSGRGGSGGEIFNGCTHAAQGHCAARRH